MFRQETVVDPYKPHTQLTRLSLSYIFVGVAIVVVVGWRAGSVWGNLGFIWLNHAWAVEDGERGKVAEGYFTRAIASQGVRDSWQRALGLAFLVQGQVEGATAVWQDMPLNYYDELLQWGQLAMLAKRYESARQWYTLAAGLLPQRREAWYQLGNVALAQDEAERALHNYQRVLQEEDGKESSVHDGDVYCQIGWLYHWLVADAQEALFYYDLAVENGRFAITGQQQACAFKRAELLLWRLNQPVQAEMGYREVVALQPDHLQAQATLALAHYMATQELETAVTQLETLAQQHPTSIWAFWRLGDVYYQAGLLAEARLNYGKALAIEPTNKGLQTRMQQLEGEGTSG